MRRMVLFRSTLLITYLLSVVYGNLQNFTLDDTNGDQFGNKPVYIGTVGDSVWNHGPDAPWRLIPDGSRVSDGTWHDGTFRLGDEYGKAIEINFTG